MSSKIMIYSPIPTDICLVELDDNSVDEFDTPEQSPVYDTDDPSDIDCDDSPCTIADSYNWSNNNIDDICALVNTGAMVTCTGTKHIIHQYKPYTKLRQCPIRLKAALSSNDCVIPEGHGFLHVHTADGYRRVLVYYHPSINGMLLSPPSVIDSAREPNGNFTGQLMHRWFEEDVSGNMTLILHHRISKSRNIVINGRLFGGQLYTHLLVLHDISPDNPKATVHNSFQLARTQDKSFIDLCKHAVEMEIAYAKAYKHRQLNETLRNVPQMFKHINIRGLKHIIDKTIPVYAIKAKTEKLLWHQCLGHPCDEYLYNAHKFIDGVPKFDQQTPILDQCPTCIQAKQTKIPAGPHSTWTATQPYQGLSIDFCFTGISSKDSACKTDYEGINGKACWILITDHFTGMKHGNTPISKGPPLQWLAHFLAQYNPQCEGQYVYLDQGGELFNHPEVQNLFKEKGYDILPTGADNSHQNGPVK